MPHRQYNNIHMQEPIKNRRSGNEYELRVPLSDIYKFNRPEVTKGLIDAHKEGPAKNSDMRPAKRFIVSSGGIFLLMVGLIGLFSKESSPLTIIWFIAGILVLWFFLFKPESEKRKGKADARKEKTVSVSFNKDDIVLRSRFYELKRLWNEVIEYKKTKKGLHVYFIDGTVNWLPAGCFDGTDEMNGLADLMEREITSNQISITKQT